MFASQRHYVHLQLLDGTPAIGLTHNTAGLVASYTRVGAARSAITLATQTATGAYSSGGFVEVSGTDARGLYRLDLPDAMGAAGAAGAVLSIKGTGLRPYHEYFPFEVELEVEGQAVTGTLTTSAFTTSGLSAYGVGQLNRRLLQFHEGPAAGERVLIVAHAADGTVQVAPPFTAAPVNGNRFRVL